MDDGGTLAEVGDPGSASTPWWRQPRFLVSSAALLVMAVVIVLLLISGRSGGAEAQEPTPSVTGPGESPSPSVPPSDDELPEATPSETAQAAVTPQPVETSAPPPEITPVLTSVSAASAVTCDMPSVSQPFTVSWASTGTTRVWVAMHESNAKGAPGAVGPLSASGSVSLDFPCHGGTISYVTTAESSSGNLVHKTFSVKTNKTPATITEFTVPTAAASCAGVGPWDDTTVTVVFKIKNFVSPGYVGWGASAAKPHEAFNNVAEILYSDQSAGNLGSYPVPFNCAMSSLPVGFSVRGPWGDVAYVSGTISRY